VGSEMCIRDRSWPGNSADVALIRQVKEDLRSWTLGRVVWTCDRGFASSENQIRADTPVRRRWRGGLTPRLPIRQPEVKKGAGRREAGPPPC